MILRTPIVSESYSPDESPMTDAKMPGNMLGYVAPRTGSQIGAAAAVQRDFHLQRHDAVLYRHRADLRLAPDARRHRADPQYGEYRRPHSSRPARQPRRRVYARRTGYAENGINSMAMSLAAYHEEMQHNIDRATSDLRETLEQMEIQNVELDLAKKRAQEAARIKSEFLANMSHELRTPLNGVIGFTRLTLKTDLNTTQRDHLTTIERSANNLLAIINDVLDFSKLEAGKLILEHPVPAA